MRQWFPLLLGCCLLATSSLAQTRREVWEWTDANGVKHYSDAPAPGAKKIVIVGATTTSVPPNVAPSTAKPAGSSDAAVSTVKYQRLEIWEPANETSFFGADAVVNVRVRAMPEVQGGDRLLNYLDGKLAAKENALEYQLTNVERGVHSLTSVIIDAKGNEKIRSGTVVFYVKQQPANNPRNQGPAVRPPTPKPSGNLSTTPKPPKSP
jgi:hypothetical protein